ncbi:hypothetical protein R5W60_20130 [Brucella pseudintermedia]|uniref:hypothetical protein n=1 Tax=Brucella pseudintermedia TaxID=370111 RepID=UPI00366B2487|nr:hypothetical protein R5W60_20130 [Brucella pseudintermedia]
MARPRLGDSESKRLQMVITEDELQAIDDWRFANRVDSRSEAIRRLCQMALNADQYIKETLILLDKTNANLNAFGDKISDLIENDAEFYPVVEEVFNSIGQLRRDVKFIRDNLDKATLTEGVVKNPALGHLAIEDRFKVVKDLLQRGKENEK